MLYHFLGGSSWPSLWVAPQNKEGGRMTKSNLRDPKRTDLKESPLITGGAFGGIGGHLGRSKRGKTHQPWGLFRDNIYYFLQIYCGRDLGKQFGWSSQCEKANKSSSSERDDRAHDFYFPRDFKRRKMKIIGACATNSGDKMIEQTPPIFPLPPRYIMGKGHVKVFFFFKDSDFPYCVKKELGYTAGQFSRKIREFQGDPLNCSPWPTG